MTIETIGKILPNGEVEHEYYGQGFIYKNFEAFENKTDEVCYVGEFGETIEDGHTYKDFVEIAQKFIDDCEEVKEYCKEQGETAEGIARNLFDMVDWQDPTTLILDWENSGAYTE